MLVSSDWSPSEVVDLENGTGSLVAVGTSISALLNGLPKPLGQQGFQPNLEGRLFRISYTLTINVP